MKRRLLAVLLAVAMLASSFIALPVFAAAASENLGSIDVPLNRDSQVDFSKGYTGIVTVSFDLTVSTGTGNVRIWLPIQGSDRTGTANPLLAINEGGRIDAQQQTELARITPGTAASIVWVYDTVAGTYTVSVNGGEPSAAISCGAQANVGALAYKAIEQKTATIANLTVTGDDGVVELPDLPMANGARTYHGFDQAYTGIVTLDFDLNIGAGSRFNMWLEPTGKAGYEDGGNPWLQFVAEGDLYLQDATKVGKIIHGQDNHFQVVVNLATKTFTVAINGGEPCAAHAFTGTMADIAGFDYRMQNTDGYIDNIEISAEAVATPDLPMSNGARTYYAFDQAYTGVVTLDFDLNIGSGSRFNMWLEPTGKAGYEDGGNPWLQFVAEGDLYLQDATKVGKINHGEDNHFQVVVNLDAKTFTVAINGGAPCAPHAFTGDMADIAGFDYRMQNTDGYVDNIEISAVDAPVEPEPDPEPPVVETPVIEVGASIVGEETEIYPNDVTFDVVLSKVTGLNVLALGFEYDPAVLTYKDIVLVQEGLEEIIPLNVNEVDGKITVVYGVKNALISAEDDTVWATLVFESIEPTEDEDVTATVDFTHFTASGLVGEDETPVQYDTEIVEASATTIVTLEAEISFDVNQDGAINLADLSLVMFNFNSSNAPACDVVPDGIVDVSDVVAMVSAIRAENPDLLPPVVA